MIELPEAKRNRPGRQTEATPTTTQDASSVTNSADGNRVIEITTSDADATAQHVDGVFVVVVEVPTGRYRRRVYLTAKSAERSARNAAAAGRNARVYLAELKPLHWLGGGRDDI